MITTSEPRGLLALATTLLMAHSGSGFLASADGRTYWVFGSVPRNELDFLLLFFSVSAFRFCCFRSYTLTVYFLFGAGPETNRSILQIDYCTLIIKLPSLARLLPRFASFTILTY
jgi:hypothetical protein